MWKPIYNHLKVNQIIKIIKPIVKMSNLSAHDIDFLRDISLQRHKIDVNLIDIVRSGFNSSDGSYMIEFTSITPDSLYLNGAQNSTQLFIDTTVNRVKVEEIYLKDKAFVWNDKK